MIYNSKSEHLVKQIPLTKSLIFSDKVDEKGKIFTNEMLIKKFSNFEINKA